MFAKRFFYVCAGLLCLALAYHFEAVNATAQAPSNPVVSISQSGSALAVVTANGDIYTNFGCSSLAFCSNIFGTPTPAQRESFGALKSRFRGERGAALPTPQDR